MNYEEIEVAGIDNTTQKHIVLDLGNGAFKSFPADPENPEYAAWLEAQTPKTTNK